MSKIDRFVRHPGYRKCVVCEKEFSIQIETLPLHGSLRTSGMPSRFIMSEFGKYLPITDWIDGEKFKGAWFCNECATEVLKKQ